jgi:hypothetical protein
MSATFCAFEPSKLALPQLELVVQTMANLFRCGGWGAVQVYRCGWEQQFSRQLQQTQASSNTTASHAVHLLQGIASHLLAA